MSAANLYHVPTNRAHFLREQDICICKDIGHCVAAQTHYFTFTAQTSPLKERSVFQLHFNMQDLRIPKPLANCTMNTSSSGFVSSLAPLAFIFQM